MLRKIIFRCLPVITFLALFLVIQASDVLACNPCVCKDDKRVNCQGVEYYAVYTREANESCYIDVYLINKEGRSRRAFRLTERDLAKLPEQPEENKLVKSYYEVSFYKLTTGEYQVNAGPDENGKVYVVIFTGCPAQNAYENSYVP